MSDKTFMAKENEVVKNWYLVDAAGQVVGRLASEIARRLRGKHKPIYTPYNDTGDFIVVINAEKAKFTGRKLDDKMYRRYSGFIGGLKEITARALLNKKPTEVLIHAVKGMLPKNTLGRRQLKKLKIYAGNEHPHVAQKPVKIDLL